MPKLIREGRFGPPKCFKTGSVVGTYPKPMLVLSLDPGGLDIIPGKGLEHKGGCILDITQEDIVTIKPADFDTWKAKPLTEQPKVLCVDFSMPSPQAIDLMFAQKKDSESMPTFIATCNSVLKGPTPWKTVVLDNLTRVSEIIHGFISHSNAKMLLDARQWASSIGQKIGVINAEFTKLPCHYVVIMHESTDKNEITGEIRTEAMIYSQYRNVIGGVLSQFFHQKKSNGKPIIDTTDMAYVKGIGPRWPVNLPPECGVTFKEIYGESVRIGEITLI